MSIQILKSLSLTDGARKEIRKVKSVATRMNSTKQGSLKLLVSTGLHKKNGQPKSHIR